MKANTEGKLPPPVPQHSVVVTIPKVEVAVEVPTNKPAYLDLSTYAAGVPGIVVAAFGFWVVHLLARHREREKRLTDSWQSILVLADKAADAAISAWLAEPGPERSQKISKAKQEFQMLGLSVTRISNLSQLVAPRNSISSAFNSRNFWLIFQRKTIDLTNRLKEFRLSALEDPLDDPDRPALPDKAPEIQRQLALFTHALDSAIFKCLP